MMQHTVALIKPDGVNRRLVGEIIKRIEASEELWQIDTIKRLVWHPGRAKRFYGRQHEGKPYFEELTDFMSSGPLVEMVLSGNEMIAVWRELMVGIRKDFKLEGYPLYQNLVHGSDSEESFQFEVRVIGQ